MVKSGARQIGSMVIQPVMQRQVHACLKVLKHRVMVVLRPLMQACTAPVWSVNFMTYLHLQLMFDICRFGMLFNCADMAIFSIAPHIVLI